MGKETIILSLILFNLLFLIFIGAIIIFIRQYKIKKEIHNSELKNKDLLHRKELLKTQTEIQKETMNYIGREIHDNIGQKLTLSSLYLQQLVFENKTQEITDNINNVNDIINESLSELRHLSKSLTDDTLEHNSISELIKNECKRINNLKTHTVIFKNQLSISSLSYKVKSVLLRIVQEFLQNSIKHSQCDSIKISLFNSDENLSLILQDDGSGFNTNTITSNGIGLKNMKKRAEIINGTYDLESSTNNGTKLTITIPV